MVELPELSDDQRLYLKTIFDYVHAEGKWPTYLQVENTILHTYPEKQSEFDLAEMCKSLPDNFASAFSFNHQYGQEAAFIAPVLTYFPEAQEERADFIKAVRFCVETMNTSLEETPGISSEDLSSQLHMEPLAIRKMGVLLLSETDISNGGGSNPGEGWWRIGLQRGKQGVRRFAGVETFEQYLEKRSPLTRMFSGYDAARPAQVETLERTSEKRESVLKMTGESAIEDTRIVNSKNDQSAISIVQTAFQFEHFVHELLEVSSFTSLSEAKGDQGFDYLAVKPGKSPDETAISQIWVVQVKYYAKSGVRRADLDHLLDNMRRVKADRVLLVTNTNLTSFIKNFIAKINSETQHRLEVWDGKELASLIALHPDLQKKYASFAAQFSAASPLKPEQISLLDQLDKCPHGQQTAKQYADICISILSEVFPTLKKRIEDKLSPSGFASFSALFSTRYVKDEWWDELQRESGAKYLFCVFNNDTKLIDKDAVMQVKDHLNGEFDHLAVIFCRNGASKEAKELKRQIYRETKKTIIIFEDRHLHELLDKKRNNQDPLDVIFNAVEVLQYLASKGAPMKDEHSEKRGRSTISANTKDSAKNTTLD